MGTHDPTLDDVTFDVEVHDRALAGARFGSESLPDRWLTTIDYCEDLELLAHAPATTEIDVGMGPVLYRIRNLLSQTDSFLMRSHSVRLIDIPCNVSDPYAA